MIPSLLAQLPAPSLQESVGVFDIMQKGGMLMWFILAASIVAAGVFLERLLYYHRCRMPVGEFLTGIKNLVRRKQYVEALERCDDGYGPVVNVVRSAISKRNYPPTELREIIKECAQLELPALESNLSLLATIGYIAPLLGLLGTVLGMIDAFIQISRSSGAAPVGDLAGGIWMALITTAAGLVVAIPAYAAYNYLATRLNHLVSDMERAGIEMVHALTEPQQPDIIPLPSSDSEKEKKSAKA
jgi:biopolymer transport protein ExbB